VERQPGAAAQGGEHRDAEAQVGDEVAVHDVEVDQVGPPLLAEGHGRREVGEVGGEDRRGEAHQGVGSWGGVPISFISSVSSVGSPSAVATTSEIGSCLVNGWPDSGNW